MTVNQKPQLRSSDHTDDKSNEIITISQLEVFRNRKGILLNPLPFHNKNFEKHGDTFKVNISPSQKIILTRDAEVIQHILQKNQKNYHKSTLQTKDLAKYIGDGLLTSNGEFWRVHRRMVQPAFHKKKLEGLMDIMNSAIRAELNTIPANESVDVLPIMGDIAFQVVAQSLFSADDIRKRMNTLKDITTTNQEMLIKEMRQPYLKWWFQLTGTIRKHLKLSKDARMLLDGIIEERLDSKDEKDDLLDMLLSAKYEDGSPMERSQLIDEVLILFTAGHETTANALSFTLFLLAKNKTEQEKVFEEVSKIDLKDGSIFDSLSKLGYTKQCIEESMRLFPPVYIMDRVSLEDETIKGNNFKGGSVWLMSMYELHRNKNFWDSPDEFKPNRFSAESRKAIGEYYYPFGAGPRMCVGNNFAMYEMILAIAQLVKKYKIETDVENIEMNPLISLKPKIVPIKFVPRI